eukprot:3826079-Rhodomonas_salina.2
MSAGHRVAREQERRACGSRKSSAQDPQARTVSSSPAVSWMRFRRNQMQETAFLVQIVLRLSLIHISEPTRPRLI